MKKDLKAKALTVCDVLFVLVLCFIVLLTTMMLTKSTTGGAIVGYTLDIPLLLGVIAALAIYLGFMLKNSMKDLDRLIEEAPEREMREGE
jgi:hypothetical protein